MMERSKINGIILAPRVAAVEPSTHTLEFEDSAGFIVTCQINGIVSFYIDWATLVFACTCLHEGQSYRMSFAGFLIDCRICLSFE